jgi:hypothetical protein
MALAAAQLERLIASVQDVEQPAEIDQLLALTISSDSDKVAS